MVEGRGTSPLPRPFAEHGRVLEHREALTRNVEALISSLLGNVADFPEQGHGVDKHKLETIRQELPCALLALSQP